MIAIMTMEVVNSIAIRVIDWALIEMNHISIYSSHQHSEKVTRLSIL